MILFTNGCSWTWGGGLDHLFSPGKNGNNIDDEIRLPLLWPYHLGKLIGAESVINLSDGCGSNQRIVRTSYNWLLNQNEKILANTIAIIQFTELSRFEIFDPINYNDDWQEHPSDWLKCKVDIVEHASEFSPIKERDISLLTQKVNNILAETHPLETFYKTINYLYALKGMFQSFGVTRFFIWHHGHEWLYWPDQHRKSLYNNFNVLDNIDSTEYFWNYERISSDDLHPSITGHKQIANIIYDRLNSIT